MLRTPLPDHPLSEESRLSKLVWSSLVRSSLVWIAMLAVIDALPAAADLAADARKLVGEGQGVYVEAEDGTVLVAQAADRAVHPASVSKIPTTLALLRKLGAEHRFETRFAAGGRVKDGVLHGDLLVQGSGDPYFVDENALLVLLALREAGLTRVAGDVVTRGPFLFNWETQGAAARLERALAGGVSPAAWAAVKAKSGVAGTRAPGLAFAAAAQADASGATPIVVHRSQPLVPLVKALNGFSNNIFATFAQAAGGIGEVEAIAKAAVPATVRDEIVLGDGAGANPRNRLSPRAAVAITRALHETLAKSGRTLADVLPVAGIDEGTLRHRFDAPGEIGHVVGKTGTYGDYGACALAGALHTRDRGIVYFAILNHRVPIAPARKRQDAFVRALLRTLDTERWDYVRDEAPAFTRAQVVPAARRD
jgi:D-alanyl-D-alanine carboxypeptidase/D-alanyl-D-alanine-endopeptidase (penicillin-binding protein 4)